MTEPSEANPACRISREEETCVEVRVSCSTSENKVKPSRTRARKKTEGEEDNISILWIVTLQVLYYNIPHIQLQSWGVECEDRYIGVGGVEEAQTILEAGHEKVVDGNCIRCRAIQELATN